MSKHVHAVDATGRRRPWRMRVTDRLVRWWPPYAVGYCEALDRAFCSLARRVARLEDMAGIERDDIDFKLAQLAERVEPPQLAAARRSPDCRAAAADPWHNPSTCPTCREAS